MEPTGLGVSGSVPVQTLSCLPPPQPPTPSPHLPGNSTLHLNPVIRPSRAQFTQVGLPLFPLSLCPSFSSFCVMTCSHIRHIWEGADAWLCHKSAHRRGSQSSQTTEKGYDLWPSPPLKPSTPSSLFFFFFLKFIYFRLQWVFIVVHGLLISVTSLVGEQRF